MASFSDLQSPDVALDWHEAVAVAAALAARLADSAAADGRVPACPHPEGIEVLATGDLHISGSRTIGATPAQGIALVLARLLESAPSPPELGQLVDAFAGDGPVPGTDAQTILDRLAFFERPGRTEVLAALAMRAEPAIERARQSSALDQLTERTRQAASEPARGLGALLTGAIASAPTATKDAPEAAPPERRPRRLPQWLVPASLALLGFVVAGSAAAWWLSPATPPGASPRPEDDLPIEGSGPAPARDRTAAATATPARRPDAASTAATTPGEPARPSSGRAPVGASPSAPTAPAAVRPRSTTDVDVVVAERGGRVVTPARGRTPPGSRAAPGRVFSAADPQVTPAVLIRPHLPAQPPPGVPEEQIGTLEFVVAESGEVEHVRLISPANRFQERMLVAAAKTWLFQPAMRDGRPVRYRTRVRLTL